MTNLVFWVFVAICFCLKALSCRCMITIQRLNHKGLYSVGDFNNETTVDPCQMIILSRTENIELPLFYKFCKSKFSKWTKCANFRLNKIWRKFLILNLLKHTRFLDILILDTTWVKLFAILRFHYRRHLVASMSDVYIAESAVLAHFIGCSIKIVTKDCTWYLTFTVNHQDLDSSQFSINWKLVKHLWWE